MLLLWTEHWTMEQKKLDKEFMQVEEPRRTVFQDKINSIDGELEESEKQNATISRKVNKRLAADMQRRGSFIGTISNFRLNNKVDKIKSMMREHQPKVKLIEDSILGCLGSVMAEKSTCLIRGGNIICDLEIEISHCQYSVHEFDNYINDIQECDCSVLEELRDLSCSLAFYLEVQQGSKGSTAQQSLSPQQCCDDDSYDQIMINVKSNEAKEIKVHAAATGFSSRTSGCDNAKVSDASSKMDECYKAVRVHQASSDYKRRSLQLSSISVNGLNLGPPPLPISSSGGGGGDSKADQKKTTGGAMVHESKYSSISFLHMDSWRNSSSSSAVCDQRAGSKGSKQNSCMLGAKSKDSSSCILGAKSKDNSSCILGAIKSRLGASSKSPQEEQAPLPSSASLRSTSFLSPPLSSSYSKASIPEQYHRHRTDSTNSTISNTDRSLSCCSSQLTTPAASTSTPSSAATAAAGVTKPDKSHRDYLEFRYALLFEFLPELQLQLKGDLFSTHYHSDPVFKALVRHIRKCLRFKEVLNSCLLAIEMEQDAQTKLLRRIKRLRGELETMTMVAAEGKGKGSSGGQQQQHLLSLDQALHHHHSSSSESLPTSFAKAESCSTLSSSLPLLLSSADSSSHGPQQQPPPLASSQGSSSSLYDADYLHSRLQSIHEQMAIVDMMVSTAELSSVPSCPKQPVLGAGHQGGGAGRVRSDSSCCKGTTPFPVHSQQYTYSHDESLLQEASACIEQLRGVQQQEKTLSDRLLRVRDLLDSNIQLDRQVSQVDQMYLSMLDD